MHVNRICIPEPIEVPGATFLKMTIGWEVFKPKGIDLTTTRLLQLTMAVALLLIVHHFWMNRDALKLFLKDGPKRGHFTYWVVVTFVLPMCVNKAWYWLRAAYRLQGPHTPVLQYAFFSAGDALLVPLMVIYPGLAQVVQKIWKERNPENAVIPTSEKSDTPTSTGDAEKNE
ncbi:hypothetical protein TRAPUB_4959 [Trametes pubescens]|uniref:Uncharacterized protein n=1 Tax=Trametes pubescens TaxID=154538 RepID=A0A1M2V9X3_TRAPU|nr:hypothetical protein TRAPUB_4959 [Trametes pubescens]